MKNKHNEVSAKMKKRWKIWQVKEIGIKSGKLQKIWEMRNKTFSLLWKNQHHYWLSTAISLDSIFLRVKRRQHTMANFGKFCPKTKSIILTLLASHFFCFKKFLLPRFTKLHIFFPSFEFFDGSKITGEGVIFQAGF